MASRTSLDDDGRRLATKLRGQLGSDLRAARQAAGLSQKAMGSAVGMSHAQVGRIERGELPQLTLEQACRAGMAVGLELGAKLYPNADPVRDRAQLNLLERLRARLPVAARWDTEVPLPIPGDRRAWDALVRLGDLRAGCEAETRLSDTQALERRLALKLRDGAADVLILVVADTAHNRAVLGARREHLRPLLPLDGRDVLRAFAAGRLPVSNGLVVL